MLPYHDHNAERVRPQLIERMQSGAVALVSDAGTPLISDPGYKLVRDARAAGIPVTTIPGPSAVVAALTLAGLPTDRFLFLGFLPAKAGAKAAAIAEVGAGPSDPGPLRERPAPRRHPRAPSATGLGDREAAVAREISKKFEETVTGTLVRARRALCRGPAEGRDRHRRRPAGRGRGRRRGGDRRGASRGDGPALRRPAPRPRSPRGSGVPRRQAYERALRLK